MSRCGVHSGRRPRRRNLKRGKAVDHHYERVRQCLHRTSRSDRRGPASSTNNATRTAIIRPELLVGQISDPFEQEADRVPDEAVRPPVRRLSAGAAPRQISRKCAACEEEEDEQLLRKPSEVDASAPVSRLFVIRLGPRACTLGRMRTNKEAGTLADSAKECEVPSKPTRPR